jgi:nucleoid-associated protein YgaU
MARAHRTTMLVLLVLLVMALGGMLTIFWWPVKTPPFPLAETTTVLPANAIASTRAATLPAVAPPVLLQASTEVDHKVVHEVEIPQDKLVVEPVHAPAAVTPRPASAPAPPEDQPVWRVETADFILTVERPQPATPVLKPPPLPVARLHEVIHVVVSGDTLWHIARRYLGNPFRYPELAALSRIVNPDMIYPGDIVRIQKKG